MFGLFSKKIPVVEHIEEVVHNSLYIKEKFLRIWNSINGLKNTISLEDGDIQLVLLFDIYNQYYSSLYFSKRFPKYSPTNRLNCELLSTLIYLDLSYNLHMSDATEWSIFRSFDYSRYKPLRKAALQEFQDLINQEKPFLYFGDELKVLIEFFIHKLKKQEFSNANSLDLDKSCSDLKKQLEEVHIDLWKNDLMRPEDNFVWESISYNRFKSLIEKVENIGRAEREKIGQNFHYDYSFVYSSMIIDIILKVDIRHLDKKEQLVLGAIHFIYLIDYLGEKYGYDMSTGAFYSGWPDDGAGMLMNTLTVSSEADGIGPFFIHEVEKIIQKKCRSSDKPNWLEEVKKRTEPSALPLYSADGLEKSKFKMIEDYASSLRVPGWTLTNPFYLMLTDIDFLKSAKQGLADIAKMAERNLSARRGSTDIDRFLAKNL